MPYTLYRKPAFSAPVFCRIHRSHLLLSLGVLFGIVMDNIGLGMMLGVAVGLCTGPAISVLKKNKKAEEQTDDEKQ